MREPYNIVELIKLQPDFIGFIFHEKSPRNVTEFPEITFPDRIKKTGVFVDRDLAFINKKSKSFKLDCIQLHGHETPDYCKSLKEKGFSIIKAFNISENFNFEPLREYEPFCDYFLFDSFGKNVGGNGITFNWELFQKYKGKTPFLLSGGIDSTMVKEIQSINHPLFSGIDINSGFEIKPAVKDIKQLKQFINNLPLLGARGIV